MDIREFKRGLVIDKHSLDNELEQHSHTYFTVGEEWSDAISRRDQLKEELNRVDAVIYDEVIRQEEKLAEAKVRNRIIQDQRHMDAFSEWNDARVLADRWQVLHEAYRQRGGMIRQLAELYVANYYSSSSVSHGPSKAADVRAQQGREALTKERSTRSTRVPLSRREVE